MIFRAVMVPDFMCVLWWRSESIFSSECVRNGVITPTCSHNVLISQRLTRNADGSDKALYER